MFSRLVQAVHQFIILTGASSSHRLANCGCTKKSRVAPSITRAGLLLVESAAPQLPGVTLQSIELRGKLAAQLLSPSTAALPAMAMVCSRGGSSLACSLPCLLNMPVGNALLHALLLVLLLALPIGNTLVLSLLLALLFALLFALPGVYPVPSPCLTPCFSPCLTPCIAPCLALCHDPSLTFSLPYSLHCSLSCSLSLSLSVSLPWSKVAIHVSMIYMYVCL